MKKLALSLVAVTVLCHGEFIFANTAFNWTGFYLGENAGYWASQKDHITSTASTGFINETYQIGASNVANALAQMASNGATLTPDGLIMGGHVGYNYAFNNRFLLGLHVDLDGLTNSDNNVSLQKTVDLVDFDESYVGSLAVTQKINYLGTVRARVGYLLTPTFLVYASGGFAYSDVTLETTWAAQESLGPTVFPGINAKRNVTNTLTGWTAGAGIEWLFRDNWSSTLEYVYYSLNDFNVRTTLNQNNASLSPPVLWASATANTALSLAVWNVRVGVSYHFS